jgi:single-strand DNA-binding protein
MGTFQRLVACGRVGKSPELSTSGKGNAVAKFSLAVDDTERGEKTTLWLNCIAFGRTAELCRDHVARGDMLLIEGRLSESRYTKDGVEQRYMTTMVDRVTLLPRAKGESAPVKKIPDIDWNSDSDTDDGSIPF